MTINPDKWFSSDVSKKLKVNFLFSHLIIFYWAVTDFSLFLLLLGIISYVLIGKVGSDIGFHRYFTHRSFNVNKWVRKYLLINSTIIGHGSILLWVVTHRIHHTVSDTVNDPHSPIVYGLITTWLRSWTATNKPNMMLVKDITRDKEIVFLHRHYFKVFYLWILFLIGLCFVFNNIYPLLFFFAFPNAGFFHEAGMVNGICHLYGYRSYDTQDNSKNNAIVNFLTFGNGMHNTHHAKPYYYTTDIHNRWYEFDPMKYLIKLISNDRPRVENKM
jgi:stearoyl-CoA desaturase (delta-9 desaturase)